MAKSNQRFDKSNGNTVSTTKYTDRDKRTGRTRGVLVAKRGQQVLQAMLDGDDLYPERLVRRS